MFSITARAQFPKPVISMRKFNETEFVNARTYWSLDCNVDDGCTYELRVRHQHPEDAFTFISHDAARRDPLELVTENEKSEIIDQFIEHQDDRLGQEPYDNAEAWFETKYLVMTKGEAEILAYLRRHWDAFTLLFTPAINL